MIMTADHLPPLAALKALDAAARHGSFTKAAAELHITQSAVSHQIRHLEELWGLALFRRGSRPLALTPAGAALAPVARDFLERLRGTLAGLRAEEARGPLRISLLESFALTWLVPRLSEFRERHPEIDVWLSTKEALADFASEQVDLAIRLGHGRYPGLHSTFLLREEAFPVCSRLLIERLGMPRRPAELARFPLLLRSDLDNSPRWDDWLRAAGVADLPPEHGPRFPNSHMALQAAIRGQGVALVRSAHVDGLDGIENSLAAAGLVRLFQVHCPADSAYFLVCPEGTEERPRIAAFRAWIVEQAQRSQAQYDAELGRGAAAPP